MVKPRRKLGIALLAGLALLASLALTQSAGAGEEDADPTAPAGVGHAANVGAEAMRE